MKVTSLAALALISTSTGVSAVPRGAAEGEVESQLFVLRKKPDASAGMGQSDSGNGESGRGGSKGMSNYGAGRGGGQSDSGKGKGKAGKSDQTVADCITPSDATAAPTKGMGRGRAMGMSGKSEQSVRTIRFEASAFASHQFHLAIDC
jgi:hypothetical protein